MRDLKFMLKNLENEDKAFLDTGGYSIFEKDFNILFEKSVEIYHNSDKSNTMKLKFGAILKLLSIKSNKTISVFVDAINKDYPDLNLKESEIYKWNTVNSMLIKTFNSNRSLFEIMKYCIANNIYSVGTFHYYFNWIVKNEIIKSMGTEAVLNRLLSGEKLDIIIQESPAKLVCSTCNETKTVSEMRLGKQICKDCDCVKDTIRRKGEEAGKLRIKAKNVAKISQNIESRIEEFKSTASNNTEEVNASTCYIQYESLYNTIFNNICDVIDLDLNNLTKAEKNLVRTNNKNLINLILEMEDNLWEQ